MSVIIEGIQSRVKYLGTFDLKEFYRAVREELIDRGYINSESYKYMEPYYSEKVSSDPKEAKTIWFWWRAKKDESSYFQKRMDIDFHLRFLKDVEVMVDNEKKRVQQGEIEVLFHTYLMLDPNDKWEKHWFLSRVHPLFYRRLWRKRREERKNSVIGDCYRVQAIIKNYFEIKSFIARGEAFVPAYGYKR